MRHLLFIVLLIPGLASAEIYRWTDAQGRVHFGERPGAAGAARQARQLAPEFVAVANPSLGAELRDALEGTGLLVAAQLTAVS